MGIIFVGAIFIFICGTALFRPHFGLIGYFGWVILKPEYLWGWALPAGLGLQRYIVIATILGWAIHGFSGNKIRGVPLYACIGLVVYLVLSWISSFQSRDPLQTVFFMEVIWKIVLMTILAIRILDSPGKIFAMMWVALIAQGYNAFEINMQYFRDGYSWAYFYGWAFNDSNTYSIATIPIMAFSASLALHARVKWQQILAACVFVFQLHEIFILESRGCMLGAIALGALIWWYSPKTAAIQYATIGALVLVAVLAGPPVQQEFESIFVESEDRDSSAQNRFGLWIAGWEITKDYPLLGLGPWGAETTVPEYFPGGLEEDRRALHNLFFEASTGSGIPAAIGYFSFFILPWLGLRRYWKKNLESATRQTKVACVAALAAVPAYLFSSMFSSGILLESGYLATTIACAILAINRQQGSFDSGSGMRKGSSDEIRHARR